ncbi:hypothetical protein PQX77_002378 [Marasmius sp. AFHP31]|nr:hypothetical protein PQX77_002378 [Marasmius sp. AFHP31]
MNPTNLRCLLQIYVEAQLNHIDNRDYGIGQVPLALYPFLPNRPPIFEVLQLHPEFIEAFGRPEPTNCLNVWKSEVETDIPPLNLAPTQPGSSRDTAIGYLDADEPNPESCQNTPFENVVLPRHREDPLPDLVDLRQNPYDVSLMNPEDVPWEMYYPPQFDIPLGEPIFVLASWDELTSIFRASVLHLLQHWDARVVFDTEIANARPPRTRMEVFPLWVVKSAIGSTIVAPTALFLQSGSWLSGLSLVTRLANKISSPCAGKVVKVKKAKGRGKGKGKAKEVVESSVGQEEIDRMMQAGPSSEVAGSSRSDLKWNVLGMGTQGEESSGDEDGDTMVERLQRIKNKKRAAKYEARFLPQETSSEAVVTPSLDPPCVMGRIVIPP